LLYWVERVDNGQSSAAARTGDCECSGLVISAPVRCPAGDACIAERDVVIALICTWRFDPEQLPDFGDIGRTVAISEEAVVADAMLASWEHMEQEPADELGRCQRHGGVATGAFDSVILDAEGDVIGIGSD
jgi:hypothetical protein